MTDGLDASRRRARRNVVLTAAIGIFTLAFQAYFEERVSSSGSHGPS